jgi:hypothetical protein
MTDDELLLIYKGLRDMTEAMKAREIALDAKTAALSAAIAQLGKLPETLGKQTSQYIAMGVSQSIQDDFSRPIADAVKGPIAELSRETYHAREVIAQVGKESRLQTWKWISIMVLCGVILGAFGSYYFYNQVIGRIDDRLDSIQQQITPAAPIPETKPTDGKAAKGKKGH